MGRLSVTDCTFAIVACLLCRSINVASPVVFLPTGCFLLDFAQATCGVVSLPLVSLTVCFPRVSVRISSCFPSAVGGLLVVAHVTPRDIVIGTFCCLQANNRVTTRRAAVGAVAQVVVAAATTPTVVNGGS